MNPFPPYQYTLRDKTNPYFQPNHNPTNPNPINPFSLSQVHSHISNNSSTNTPNHPSSSTQHSDKYMSYYTHQHNTSQNPFYNTANTTSNIPHPSRDNSLERKRFFTLSQFDHKHHQTFNDQQFIPNLKHNHLDDPFSQSMIITTNRPQSINKNQSNYKKQLFTFTATKFSSSRVQSQYNSRQKKVQSHSQNKSQYLERANKKVSLKRDIAPISPKYQEQQNQPTSTTPKHLPPHQPSFVNISNRFNINQNSNHVTNAQSKVEENHYSVPHQKSMPFLPSGNESSSSAFSQNISEIHRRQSSDGSQKGKNQDMIMPSTLERFSSSSESSNGLNMNRRNSQKQSKEISFKKTSNKEKVSTYDAQRAVSAYDGQRTTPSSQSSSLINQIISDNGNYDEESSQVLSRGRRTNSKPFFGSIRSNSSKEKKPSSQLMIDSEVLTDMKISRIQENTNNLEEKLLTITKTLQQLMHQSKQQQTSINEVNNYITKQQEEGLTPQDIKRIRKQLKIMKNNFETAFTSMTDQINRKLIKEESIMRSLSDQIKSVAQKNEELNQTIERRQRKVDSLEKSMTSFMRQNEERMQNLVLNESFSSTKRSKNNSFEYGLDLKNMSSDDNYSSGKSYNHTDSAMSRKLQSIQKEISKMKVFHIKEQENQQGKFAEIKKDIDKAMMEQQKYIVRTEAQHMIRQVVDEILQMKLDNWQMVQNQQSHEKEQRVNEQLNGIKQRIEELNKICHEQLYDYRMNKLNEVAPQPKFVTESKIKTMNNQLEQQLLQVQNKQRSLLIALTDCQQKLISFEDRQYTLIKSMDQIKLKELKQAGDLRQVQLSLKEVHHILHGLSSFKESALTSLNDMSQITGLQKGLLNSLQARTSNLQVRISESERINSIQTENIESINNEFQRVINKEIIPKIQEVHYAGIEINQKIHSLGTEIGGVKRMNEVQMQNSLVVGGNVNRLEVDEGIMDKKIQEYLLKNMDRFMNRKVRVISTKMISSKSPLSKIGLFKQKRVPSCISANDKEFDGLQQQVINKQETYLLDEDGYLMDWQGVYLMQMDEMGLRRKIKVSEEQLYFMQVNGLQIKRV